MGKRSKFERLERDYYQTPSAAVVPLIPFLPKDRFTFAEPCAGDGRLVKHVRDLTDKRASCWFAADIEPDHDDMMQKDALALSAEDVANCDMIITNPPWERRPAKGQLLHKLITHFLSLDRPTWLLFDSDWMQTAQARPYLPNLLAVVSIGRVKWIEGSKMTGKDNCQWHLFHPQAQAISTAPAFFGRGVKPYEGFVDTYHKPVFSPRDALRAA